MIELNAFVKSKKTTQTVFLRSSEENQELILDKNIAVSVENPGQKFYKYGPGSIRI